MNKKLSSMIVVKLMGGLGNQMFQYALGRHLAIKNNTSLKLDLNFLNDRTPKENFTYRNYELDIFKIKCTVANSNDLKRFNFYDNHYIYFLKSKLKLSNVFKEHYLSNVNNALSASDNSYLDGYWQSEKYFKDIENIIREEFSFKEKPDIYNCKLLKEITSLNSVSIHVRRGDYVLNKHTNNVHGICPLEYYQKAVEIIAENIENISLYIFSDDPEWVQSNLKLKYPMKFVTHNVGDKNYEDLRLMSHCRHNIIANSSFSWWGAWLNENPDKIVIAPKKWFNDQSLVNSDLIPKEWLSI